MRRSEVALTLIICHALRRLQDKINAQRIEWKYDFPIRSLRENSHVQQRTHIAVDRFHVAPSPARGFTYRNRARPGKRIQEFPALGGQDLKEQCG